MRLLAPVLALVVLVSAGCAATAPPVPAPEAEAAPAPAAPFVVAGVSSTGLVLHGAAPEPLVLAPGATEAEVLARAGERAAIRYVADGRAHLALLEADGTLTPVHDATLRTVYTAAFDASGTRLAFGFYAPRRDGSMGTGALDVFAGGERRSVGCSASKAVYAWSGDDALVTSDGARLYRVAVDGCATLARLDLTKRHHATVAPDGAHVAFIQRELEYDRSARAYVPDSSLHVADWDGSTELVMGSSYTPRNLAWSPDGQALAYDVSVPDAAGRAVSIYELAQGKAIFLVPPAQGSTAADVHPRWSPGGERVLFTRREGGRTTFYVQTPGVAFVQPVEGDRFLGWVGNDAVLMQRGEQTAVVPVAGGEAYAVDAMPVVAWPR